MELTTKGRYAVMAMAELARQGDEPAAVPLSHLAEPQNLPVPYLEQLFVSLRRAGLVESSRGRAGGYRLARPAADISIAAVMNAVEEETHFTRCSQEQPHCLGETPCLTHGLWTALGEVTTGFLKSVTLADVIAGKALAPEAAAAAPAVARSHRVYLDYNATAPLRAEAKAAMLAAMDEPGNASSVHAEGRKVRGLIEKARESVAKLVGAKPSEVVFTSGATESNNWVMAQPWSTIFVAGIEHDSVLAAARANTRAETVKITTTHDGVVNVAEIAERMVRYGIKGAGLVALQAANNETGVIQPLADVAAFAREHGLHVHSDAVQAAGRLPLDFAGLGLDTMAITAHKIGGPKGIGALVIRDHLDLVPQLRGGGQERRRRAGTENIAAIAGFGAAAEAARAELADVARIAALRDELERGVREISPATVVIGANAQRLPNTALLATPGKLAETLVIRLDLAGFAVSAGSACSSGKVGASHVLIAMDLDADTAKSGIRVSLGRETTREDVASFISAWQRVVAASALAA